MRNFIKYGILLIFILSDGCKDSSTNGGVAGNMVGYVVVYDTTGTNRDYSGVRISIDGTSYSTFSNSEGRWELHDVEPGTYNISFTKNGYATQKNIAYRFVGNGTDYLYSQNIYQIIFMNASLVLRPFIHGSAIFSCRLFRTDPSEALMGSVMLLFGKNPALSPEKPDSYMFENDNLGDNYYYLDTLTGYNFTIDSSALSKAGLHPQDTIYVQAFGSNLFILQGYDPLNNIHIYGPSYVDITNGKRVYTGFGDNHSEVKSFILP